MIIKRQTQTWNEEHPFTQYIYNIFVDDIIVATAKLQHLESGDYSIQSVYVYDEYRGKGYARKLMQHIITDFNVDMYLLVWKKNKAAIRLYKSCGFTFYNNDEDDSENYMWMFRSYKLKD